MKYQTVYMVLASGFSHSEEIDASEGLLSKGAPSGVSRGLCSLLSDMDMEWLHNKAGVYFLVNNQNEPVLSYNQKTQEIQKFHPYLDEIKQQSFAKDLKRLLDQVVRVLAKKEKE
jgi:hypothetical protein